MLPRETCGRSGFFFSSATARDVDDPSWLRVKLIESTKEEGNICFKSGKFEEALVKYDDVLEVS